MQNSDHFIFEQIGDLSKDVYFTFDSLTNKVLYIGPAFDSVWGISRQQIFDDPMLILDTVHPEDRDHVEGCFMDCIEDHSTKQFEFRIVGANASEKYIKVNIYPMVNNGRLTTVAGIAEDITVLRTNIAYSEKINARKNTTLDILSHDLKGPIGVINMMASQIKKESIAVGNTSILNAVQFIQQLCERNIILIRDLMDQEFLESAEVELKKERADLVAEITDVVDHYKKATGVLARTFMVNCAQPTLLMMFDSLKLMQVINNLISNSIKFTPVNGMIKIDIEEREGTVMITMSDNGIGIPKELQPYLFDKFTRARRKGLNGEEPTGLGMSIIKTLVELHGGTIDLQSDEGQGCSFFIEIPKA